MMKNVIPYNPYHDKSIAENGVVVAENFSQWFGQSQVRHESGVPLVMYHGSPVFDNGMGDLHEFDRLWTVQNLRGRESSIDNVGCWFSSNPSEDGGAGMYSSSQGVIYPVYLSIQNPYITTFDMLVRRMHQLNGDHDKADQGIGKGDVHNLRWWLRESGRDGIKIVHDPRSARGSTEFLKQDAWIALMPNQIKSAVGNSGLYLTDSYSLTDKNADRTLLQAHQARSAIEQMVGAINQKVMAC